MIQKVWNIFCVYLILFREIQMCDHRYVYIDYIFDRWGIYVYTMCVTASKEIFCCDLRGRKYKGSGTVYADKLSHASASSNLDIINIIDPPSKEASIFYYFKTVHMSKRLILIAICLREKMLRGVLFIYKGCCKTFMVKILGQILTPTLNIQILVNQYTVL